MGTHTGRAPLRLVRSGARGRTLAVLHPALASRYVRLVAAVAPTIEAGLSPAVAANRVRAASVDPPLLRLRPFEAERAAFRRRLVELAAARPFLLFADVRACFGSIAPSVVGSSLTALACDAHPTTEVVALLRRLGSLGVRGLPVGPEPSAVLANAVLASIDRALRARRLPHLRWVDDIVVGVAGPGEAADALDRLAEVLASQGLELNRRKTRVVVGAVAAADALPVSPGPREASPLPRRRLG